MTFQIYVEDVFKAITTSALKCPTVMCQLFHTLKEVAITFFPGSFFFFFVFSRLWFYFYFNTIKHSLKKKKKIGRFKQFGF